MKTRFVSTKYIRIGIRSSSIMLRSLLVLGIVTILAIAFFLISRNPDPVISVIISSSPTWIFYADPTGDPSVILTLPQDVMIPAVHGYGSYTLSGLEKLERIEKKPGLVRNSVAGALGIPVSGFFQDENPSPSASSAIQAVKTVFRLKNLIPFIFGRYHTNLKILEFIRLSLFIWHQPESRITEINIAPASGVSENRLPDGSFVKIFDMDTFDQITDHQFELVKVSDEKINVAVINTTAIPGLAQREARLLSNIGMFIESVGNETGPAVQCEVILADKKYLNSWTYQIIQWLYSCRSVMADDSNRADITLRLGQNQAALYQP